MPHIDYYLSTISPNVYNAGTRLEEIADRHGATITYKPVDIGGIFGQTGGTPLPQRHENRKVYRLQELERGAKLAGHPINTQPAFFPANGAPSAYAIIAAQEAGGGNLGQLCHDLAKACWAEEKDVSDDAVIGAALEANGFSSSLTMSGMLTGAETFTRNTEEAIKAGVFGVPFYITDTDERFWGQDRLEMLDMHLSGKL